MPGDLRPRLIPATTLLALLGTLGVTGCGHAASPRHASAAETTETARATETAGEAAATGLSAYPASQLEGALLTSVGGERPAAAAETGDYGTLPDVQTSEQTMKGVKIRPASCAEVSATGFNSAALALAPAAIVTFRVGRDGVSEVLISAPPQLAAAALSDSLPTGCAHYQARVDGKTFNYSVREATPAGVADQARAVNVKATGYAEVNVWSVVYRGRGFVGAVTMVGPDTSEQGVSQLAREAYACAARLLP
jgi:hypothetical protein